MKYKKILVTGGAGFVGSYICINLKKNYEGIEVIALDNLIRAGSQLNISRLTEHGVIWKKGDVRIKKDLEIAGVDLIIECSAEPSVMAGVDSSPEYVLDTNLFGAINCFELARRNKADVIFLSTSRVYPIKHLNDIFCVEEDTRFVLSPQQEIKEVSDKGITENFPLDGVRSMYGTTKLSAELILQEYIQSYGICAVIDRFGLIAGPWQMGKIDQGVITYWIAHHIFNRDLSYIGFGGKGKQTRDVLHVDDLFNLIDFQINNIDHFSGEIYNVGGGIKNSISLMELTQYCQDITGKKIFIDSIFQERPNDIRIYISDYTKLKKKSNWSPKKNIKQVIEDTYEWIAKNNKYLKKYWSE